MNNLKRGYITPELTVHGSLAKITLGNANGKGPEPLDPNGAQPNSKCPSGSDGLGGCEIS